MTLGQQNTFDIVICGAGVVGLTLACLLADAPFRVLLIEQEQVPRQPRPVPYRQADYELVSGYSPRVSALHTASVTMLTELGAFLHGSRYLPFTEMVVRDSQGSAAMQFFAADIKQPYLGYIIENQQLVYSLWQLLKCCGNVNWLFGARVEDIARQTGGYELLLATGERISSQLLIAADGSNSKIRQVCGLKTAGWDYQQRGLVTTILTEKPHRHTARQWFTQAGPLAFLPLFDSRLCSIVWSSGQVQTLLTLAPKTFCQHLTDASEGELGQVLATDQRFSFPLKQQHSYRYGKPYLALIGDAAHSIHPLAGQGANLGLADAKALAIEIQQTVFTGASPGDSEVLNRYAARRQPHNLLVGGVMEGLARFYGSRHPAITWLRNTGMQWVNDQQNLKTMLVRLAGGR